MDYKPFDAIINFLPHGLPDKTLLKHAILVTTLSSQFLASPTYISTASPQTDSRTCPSHNPTNRASISSPSHSYSSASSSSSASTADTSPSPSPQPRRLSKLATSTSRAKNRLSFLFHAVPPPPPPPKVSNVKEAWKVKNAHLVHVLPLGWSPDSGEESDRGDKRALSSLSPSALAGPSRSAGYTKTPTREHTGGTTWKPKLVQSIEQFLLSFAYPLGSLVSGHSGSALNSESGTDLSSPSSNLKQRPKSALVHLKEHAPSRASTSTSSPSTSNLTNTNTLLKPVPYLLAPGVFASYASRSNVRSKCSLPEDGLEQNFNQDTRGDAYMDTHTDPGTTALTIGEIILLGALDFDHTRPGTRPRNGRAWIGDVGDVVVVGGNPDSGLSSRKAGIEKGKGREVAVVNMEVMKTTKRNFNGLLTPPESLNSNTESEEEEAEINGTRKYARPIPPALSTYSPPTHLDDHGNRNRTLNTRSKHSKRMSSPSSVSTPPPTPASRSKQTNYTSDKVKDKNSNRFLDSLSSPSPLPLPSRSPIQLPPSTVHSDRVRSPRTKAGSRSASGSGIGSAMIPLQTQGDDTCRRAYGGKTRSPEKGSERKGFVVSALRRIGLWNKW